MSTLNRYQEKKIKTQNHRDNGGLHVREFIVKRKKEMEEEEEEEEENSHLQRLAEFSQERTRCNSTAASRYLRSKNTQSASMVHMFTQM